MVVDRAKFEGEAKYTMDKRVITIEMLGMSLIVGGIWFLNQIVAIIIMGILLVILAQGLTAGRNRE
jgi:hypothetical protein